MTGAAPPVLKDCLTAPMIDVSHFKKHGSKLLPVYSSLEISRENKQVWLRNTLVLIFDWKLRER